MALGLVLVVVGTTDAFGAARGTSFAPCLPGASPVTVHFTVGPAASGSSPFDLVAYSLTGFSVAGCDGSTVVLTVRGNSAGDSSLPDSLDATLATYNTAVDACTQHVLSSPLVINNGGIVIKACPGSAVSGTVSVHDATGLKLEVRGQTIPVTPVGPVVTTTPTAPTSPTTSPTNPTTGSTSPTTSPTTAVLGETFTNSGSGTPPLNGSGHTSVLATMTQLPFTGTYAALTFWVGVLLIIGGFFFVLLGRRRRRPQDPELSVGGRHT